MRSLEDIYLEKSMGRYKDNAENRRLHRVGQPYKRSSQETKLDRNDHPIGDGSVHSTYRVLEFPEYPQVSAKVSKSATTESVYVTYTNEENGERVTARFSTHENNAVKFGDQLNGNLATKNEILALLGLKKRTFIPNTRLYIATRQVSKKDLESGKFEVADKTMKEIYALGANADLSKYKGKVAKDSNYLILSDKVRETEEYASNGARLGRYVYED